MSKYKLYSNQPPDDDIKYYHVEFKEFQSTDGGKSHTFHLKVNGELVVRLSEYDGVIRLETWPECPYPEGLRQIAYRNDEDEINDE